MTDEEKDIPFVRGNILENLNVLEYSERTLKMIDVYDRQIKKLEEEVAEEAKIVPKNPREESIKLHNLKTLDVLRRQKERLEYKLVELQEMARRNIEGAKKLKDLPGTVDLPKTWSSPGWSYAPPKEEKQ